MKNKTTSVILELNDGINVADGMEIIMAALKDIEPKFNSPERGVLEWDVSKNVPGYSVKVRDEGVGKPHKYIVSKAKRVRKTSTQV